MIEITRISTDDPLFEQACRLREEVLLAPLGLDLAAFRAMDEDLERRAEHYVAILDHPLGPRVVGAAMLLAGEPDPESGRVVQMVVDRQRQGEGIGRRLLTTIESRAFGELGLEALTCEATTMAVPFYKALGWSPQDEAYEHAGIPHQRMGVRVKPPADPA